jgi:c(7)-type cytochrome triheme protein
MRRILIALTLSCFVAGSLATLAQEKKTPAKLTFTAYPGNVTFNHAEHVKRVGGECTFCHNKPWPQSSTAPLNYKWAEHNIAEGSHTSCGKCQHAGSHYLGLKGAFGTEGNCAKCHVKAS